LCRAVMLHDCPAHFLHQKGFYNEKIRMFWNRFYSCVGFSLRN
jgi:hypothetical protein